jgi:dephospho-CoA kinase
LVVNGWWLVVNEGSRVRRIALTGGIATGKSRVRARLEALGVPTIDADILARHAVAPGTPGLVAVVERFGSSVLATDGSLNRRALADIVFADPEARRDLENIIHPAVRIAMDRWFESLDPRRHSIAVADIPLLFETGRETEFEAVVLTIASPSIQLQRLMQRDGLTEADAARRISAQLPASPKERRATYVIDTNGTLEETDRQIDDVYRRLVSR